MLRIVLPAGISTASAPTARLLRWAVSAPYVVAVATINIRVPIEIIVVVDVRRSGPSLKTLPSADRSLPLPLRSF